MQDEQLCILNDFRYYAIYMEFLEYSLVTQTLQQVYTQKRKHSSKNHHPCL